MNPQQGCSRTFIGLGRGIKGHPLVQGSMDGDTVHVETFEQEGASRWYSIDVQPGAHHVTISLEAKKGSWNGSAGFWLIGNQRLESRTLRCELAAPPKQRPMPPLAWPKGEVRKTVSVGRVNLALEGVR